MGHSRLFPQNTEYKLNNNYEILYKFVLCLTTCDSDNHHKLVNVLGLLYSKLLFAIFASKGWMVVISVTFHLKFGWVNQPTALYLAFVIGDKCMHCLTYTYTRITTRTFFFQSSLGRALVVFKL